jgi:hypothetical protein
LARLSPIKICSFARIPNVSLETTMAHPQKHSPQLHN